MIDIELGKRILALRERVFAEFNSGDWEEIGLLTGFTEQITRHPRLLRSLGWGDEDYAGNVLEIIRKIAQEDERAFEIFEKYVEERYPGEGVYVSAKPSERKITFAPNVFQIPDMNIETDLVAVMMPFKMEFDAIYNGIRLACGECNYRCLRVDEIWEESSIIQDIFNLIFRAHIIVVDFTGKNPNVMYETGIAHTLGKHVIPMAQSLEDVPFDMIHHRTLKYLPNAEGVLGMKEKLIARLRNVSS